MFDITHKRRQYQYFTIQFSGCLVAFNQCLNKFCVLTLNETTPLHRVRYSWIKFTAHRLNWTKPSAQISDRAMQEMRHLCATHFGCISECDRFSNFSPKFVYLRHYRISQYKSMIWNHSSVPHNHKITRQKFHISQHTYIYIANIWIHGECGNMQ